MLSLLNLPAACRGASESCQNNFLLLDARLPLRGTSGQAFIPSHQGRGIIRMSSISALKSEAFWHVLVKRMFEHTSRETFEKPPH
jgi:hypothetical protein